MSMLKHTWGWALLFLPIFLSQTTIGQDKILLQNGSVIECDIEQLDDSVIHFGRTTKKGKQIISNIETYRAFSVVQAGKESIMYVQDSMIGNLLTIPEMRLFINGEQDAMANYARGTDLLVGAGVGLLGGYMLTGNYLAIAVPLVTSIASTPVRINIARTSPASPELHNDANYALGYRRVAKSKRLFRVLYSGLVGSAVGFSLGYIVSPGELFGGE